MKILCAFDKFKGSLSALKVGNSVINGLKDTKSNFKFKNIPLSDGGEGFLKILKEPLNLTIKQCKVTGPLGSIIDSEYGIGDGFSVIEMSYACGLELVPKTSRNPLHTTSRGVGELILDSYNQGIKKIILGIGGSATNDAGLGALQVLGLKINKKNGKDDVFYGRDLVDVISFDSSSLLDLDIEIACDVMNPFTGENGAVSVFSPQKGASKDDQLILENGMKNILNYVKSNLHKDLNQISGSGAAGGFCGGFVAFTKSKVVKGSELIAKHVQLEKEVQESDIVFTGEGSYDDQTDQGKVVSYVMELCEKYKKPCIIICGKQSGNQKDNVFDLTSMFSFEKSMKETEQCIMELVQKNKEKMLSKLE